MQSQQHLDEIKKYALQFLEGATTCDEFGTQTLIYLIEHQLIDGKLPPPPSPSQTVSL